MTMTLAPEEDTITCFSNTGTPSYSAYTTVMVTSRCAGGAECGALKLTERVMPLGGQAKVGSECRIPGVQLYRAVGVPVVWPGVVKG